MATLEAVTVELQNLNGLSDFQLESTLEQNERLTTLSTNVDKTNDILSEILDVMRQFMNVVPEQIVQGFQPIIQSIETNNTTTVNEISRGFEALVDLEERSRLFAEREKDAETPTTDSDPKTGFFASNFQKGFESKPLEKASSGILKFIAEIIQTVGAIAGVVAAIGGIGAIIPAITAAVAGLAPVIAVAAAAIAGVIAVVNGLITAFEWFNNQEGSLGDKILAALEGFVRGIVQVITWPIDFIKDLISKGIKALFGENEVTKFLDSFTIFETITDALGFLFNVLEDFLEFIEPVTDFIGGTLSSAFGLLFDSIKFVASTIGNVIDSLFGMANKVIEFFGGDPIGQAPSETIDAVQLTEEQEDTALRDARQSELYNKNIIGESEIDESKLKEAPTSQLQAIVNDDDLSPEQRELVITELEERTDTKRKTNKKLSEMSEEKVTVQKRDRRGRVIGDQPEAPTTRDPETGKLGRVIGDSPSASATEISGTSREVGGVVVEVNGERRTEFTEEEIKKINAARNAAITMGNPDPLPNFEANVVSSSQSTSTDSTLVYPVTNYAGEVVGAFNTPEEAAQWAIENQGIVVNAMPKDRVVAALQDDTATAVATPAMNAINSIVTSDATSVGQSVLNDLSSDSSSVVSGSNDRSEMNETMIQETTKLNDNRSEVGGAGGIVAPTVNANNNSTNVTSNTTNVHGIPSAVDKSDRTDRRGAFRGRAI